MSLDANLQSLATRTSTQDKLLLTLMTGNVENLAGLSTTAKTTLIAAINELKTLVDNAAATGGAVINDAATNSSEAWSSTKIAGEISAAITALVGDAPGVLDTLGEIATALADDADLAGTLSADIASRVSYTTAQSLTGPQQAQALANIGAVAAADVGPTDTDYVAIFEAGLV